MPARRVSGPKLTEAATMSGDEDERRDALAIAEEEVVVAKRTVSTGSVRLSTHVEQHIEQVRETLLRTDVDLERVVINRIVDRVPEVRTEGETLVYPIVEEVLVKQLVLREEVRITHRQRSEPFAQDVTLRRVRADINHVPAPLRPQVPPEQS